MGKIYYTCDKRSCGINHECGECFHTTDIEHAVKFEKTKNGDFIERPRYKPGTVKELTEPGKRVDINDLP